MGEVIDISRRGRAKFKEGFWRQEYLLFPCKSSISLEDLPCKNKVPDGAEVTLHPGNSARLLVNGQLLRIVTLAPRELREAVFVTPPKILRFKYAYNCRGNILLFDNFLKFVSMYVNNLNAVVLDNLGMRCWFPEKWLQIIRDGRFDFRNHLVIHSALEKEPGHFWLHTHGMAQFACPDLEVRMVTGEDKELFLYLLCILIGRLIKHGPLAGDGGRMAVVKWGCWVTLKHCRETPGEGHYRNNYYRISILTKK